MRKGIVLLIVALLYGFGVFARPDSKVPATDTSCPTVTLTQEQFDSLVSAASKSNQMERIAQTEAEKMFDDYTTHVNWIIGLFGVLITLLVGLLGALFPYMTNESYKRELDGKIAIVDEKIADITKDMEGHEGKIRQSNQDLDRYKKELGDYNESLEKMKGQIDRSAKVAQEAENKAIAIALFAWARQLHDEDPDRAIKMYERSISKNPNFAEAYNNLGSLYYRKKSDYDKAVSNFCKAIDLNPKSAKYYFNRGKVYMERGHDGDYELAMKDFETCLTHNPKESTRKKLESKMEELKAKMQKPKEDA